MQTAYNPKPMHNHYVSTLILRCYTTYCFWIWVKTLLDPLTIYKYSKHWMFNIYFQKEDFFKSNSVHLKFS